MTDIARRGDYPISDWDPFRIMRQMMRWDPFRLAMLPQLERDLWMPHFEVRENGSSIKIFADVPGIRREDLDLSITGNRLVVTGRREAAERHKDESIHTWERQFGEFTRTFTLPDNVDLDHVTSELRDGVLTVVLPMRAGSPTRKIQVGGANPRS
jgi:HSP20 family protein